MIIIFYYMLALVAYCWLDSLILFKIQDNPDDLIDGLDTLSILHNFAFGLFILMLLFTILRFNKYKLINIIYIGLCYIKYAGLFIFVNSVDNYKFELRRIIMWLFVTPAMLDMYTKANKISFRSINPEYHLVPNLLYCLTYHYSKSIYYNLFYGLSYVSQGFFLYNLYRMQNLKYTRIFIFIWLLFGSLNIINIFDITTTFQNNIYLSISDIIAKFTTMIVIYDFEEQKTIIRECIDLQSVDLIGSIFSLIDEYKKNNILTESCSIYINFLTQQLKTVYPNQETKKIL